jgi:hypothetical protein
VKNVRNGHLLGWVGRDLGVEKDSERTKSLYVTISLQDDAKETSMKEGGSTMFIATLIIGSKWTKIIGCRTYLMQKLDNKFDL